MKHVAPQIGLAETPRGWLVSLPPRFWLLVSLRRTFRGVQAAPDPWTYLVPARGADRRLGEWMAEVELQLLAESRRRAWTASEAEWTGSPISAPAAASSAEPAIVELPKQGTARATLELLARLAAGEVLTVAIADGARHYRLTPSGRAVRPQVAERAIGERLIVPSCDGLFGPEWSQTWRAPYRGERDAAKDQGGDRRAESRARRTTGRRPAPGGAETSRPARAARALRSPAHPGAPDRDGRARARRGGGVA